jgi:hypothetical protein
VIRVQGNDWPDYFTALGQEFCNAIDPDGTYDVVPMDAADAVITYLGQDGALQSAMASLDAAGRAKLAWHLSVETGAVVTPEQVDDAIAAVLARWPAT